MTEELDPLSMLTDDADIASWNNEGKSTELSFCKIWNWL